MCYLWCVLVVYVLFISYLIVLYSIKIVVLLTQADLVPLVMMAWEQLQLSVEVGVTSIEAYGRGYVATDVQLLVNLKT
jgi:hypothetical protein